MYRNYLIIITLSFLILNACADSKAAVSESWTIVNLLTKGEQTDTVVEIIEVKNCGIEERKTAACSAGTSSDMSVELGGSVSPIITISAGVANSLGIGRGSGESLDLDSPPNGFIYLYSIEKTFRILAGDILARSSEGNKQTTSYTFHASCSMSIISREELLCINNPPFSNPDNMQEPYVTVKVEDGVSSNKNDSCSNKMRYIKDITIPDGSDISPGVPFIKTWRVKNIGTCIWSGEYSIAFIGGDSIGAKSMAPLEETVNPGETIDISISLIAPSTSGEYTGYWELKDTNGVAFGDYPDNAPLYVTIHVIEN